MKDNVKEIVELYFTEDADKTEIIIPKTSESKYWAAILLAETIGYEAMKFNDILQHLMEEDSDFEFVREPSKVSNWINNNTSKYIPELVKLGITKATFNWCYPNAVRTQNFDQSAIPPYQIRDMGDESYGWWYLDINEAIKEAENMMKHPENYPGYDGGDLQICNAFINTYEMLEARLQSVIIEVRLDAEDLEMHIPREKITQELMRDVAEKLHDHFCAEIYNEIDFWVDEGQFDYMFDEEEYEE